MQMEQEDQNSLDAKVDDMLRSLDEKNAKDEPRLGEPFNTEVVSDERKEQQFHNSFMHDLDTDLFKAEEERSTGELPAPVSSADEFRERVPQVHRAKMSEVATKQDMDMQRAESNYLADQLEKQIQAADGKHDDTVSYITTGTAKNVQSVTKKQHATATGMQRHPRSPSVRTTPQSEAKANMKSANEDRKQKSDATSKTPTKVLQQESSAISKQAIKASIALQKVEKEVQQFQDTIKQKSATKRPLLMENQQISTPDSSWGGFDSAMDRIVQRQGAQIPQLGESMSRGEYLLRTPSKKVSDAEAWLSSKLKHRSVSHRLQHRYGTRQILKAVHLHHSRAMLGEVKQVTVFPHTELHTPWISAARAQALHDLEKEERSRS
jgi:hypothetical protein